MSISNPTLEDVWQLFRENAAQQKENDRQFQEFRREADRRFQETERRFQETERRFQETERRFQETELRFQEIEQLFRKQSSEADRRFQETERLIREQSRETDKKIGALGNRLGEFVEGFVAPAVIRLFRERQIAITGLSRNIERESETLGLATQIDLLALNGDMCVVIEVKSNLSIDDVNDHLERLAKFKLLFPEYAHYQTYGAVAGMVMPIEVSRYAYRKGLFVLAQSGDAIEIRNDGNFKPKTW